MTVCRIFHRFGPPELKVIDERCGKPKSLEGASEGLIADPLFLAMMTISFLTLGRPQPIAKMTMMTILLLLLSGQTPTPPSHLDELRQICQEYYNTMWKVESEKYDEEFELMKKDFEVAYLPKYRVHPHLTLDRVRHPLT